MKIKMTLFYVLILISALSANAGVEGGNSIVLANGNLTYTSDICKDGKVDLSKFIGVNLAPRFNELVQAIEKFHPHMLKFYSKKRPLVSVCYASRPLHEIMNFHQNEKRPAAFLPSKNIDYKKSLIVLEEKVFDKLSAKVQAEILFQEPLHGFLSESNYAVRNSDIDEAMRAITEKVNIPLSSGSLNEFHERWRKTRFPQINDNSISYLPYSKMTGLINLFTGRLNIDVTTTFSFPRYEPNKGTRKEYDKLMNLIVSRQIPIHFGLEKTKSFLDYDIAKSIQSPNMPSKYKDKRNAWFANGFNMKIEKLEEKYATSTRDLERIASFIRIDESLFLDDSLIGTNFDLMLIDSSAMDELLRKLINISYAIDLGIIDGKSQSNFVLQNSKGTFEIAIIRAFAILANRYNGRYATTHTMKSSDGRLIFSDNEISKLANQFADNEVQKRYPGKDLWVLDFFGNEEKLTRPIL